MTLDELRNSDRAIVTVTEAAAVLEVDERTVRRACEAGQLPHLRVGVRLLLPREAFLALLTPPPVEGVPTDRALGQVPPPTVATPRSA